MCDGGSKVTRDAAEQGYTYIKQRAHTYDIYILYSIHSRVGKKQKSTLSTLTREIQYIYVH